MDIEKAAETKLKVISVDFETVRIFCPKSDQYVSLGLKFPSVKSLERFLESPRRKEDVYKYGGQMVGHEANHTIMLRQEGNEDAGTKSMSIDQAAANFGITVRELQDAEDLAWRTLLEAFSGKGK